MKFLAIILTLIALGAGAVLGVLAIATIFGYTNTVPDNRLAGIAITAVLVGAFATLFAGLTWGET